MQKLCTNCNQTNPADALFCRQCASPLSTVQPPRQQYATPQQNVNPPQWNQPNYAVQSPVAAAPGSASSRAMAAAGLAVVGLLCCGFVAGIPAAILGWLELTAIKEGKAPAEGMMMAQVGLWLGIIGSVVNAVINLILFILMGLGGQGY